MQRYKMVYNSDSEITSMQRRPDGDFVKYRTVEKTLLHLQTQNRNMRKQCDELDILKSKMAELKDACIFIYDQLEEQCKKVN